MKKRIVWLVLLLLPGLVQAKDAAPTDADLAAITARGRMLAEYDIAAWHATDAMVALNPDIKAAPLYIARRVNGVWEVAFGRLSPAPDKFLILYRATQTAGPQDFSAKKEDPVVEDRSYYLAAAKAIELAVRDFGPQNRNYNTYVLPTESGQLYVYLLPAPSQQSPHPLGHDVRYTITLDGGTIVDKRMMHKGMIHTSDSAPGTVVAETHSHVLSDAPEDSDVFYVLTGKPAMPEYIATADKHTYVIEKDGTIKRSK